MRRLEQVRMHSARRPKSTSQKPTVLARYGSLLLLLAGLLLTGPRSQAQLYTGSVTGVVTDPSGSTVPGTKITLLDLDKGFS